jgi:lactate racemase
MPLGRQQVREIVEKACPGLDYRGKRVLLLVPDHTRTAPVDVVFQALCESIGESVRSLDVLVALGTHPPLSRAAICSRLGISEEQAAYPKTALYNHAWDDPAELRQVGVLTADEVSSLSGGLFSMEVPVRVNRRLFEYDRVIIIGPVFPHEVVGFSGGNKYFFPGVGGPEILNFFHWLGAVVTNARIIGNKWTPVRKVVDRAAGMVGVDKYCFCMVVGNGNELAGLFHGTPEAAWDQAADLSRELHVVFKAHPYHTILSCAPAMYDELWTAGKCMYKLEPVLADGGELIIYAPHLKEVSLTHGRHIEAIGYHCRDYFLKQWDRFKHFPWGVLAHSTHVRGIGQFENGVEQCRAKVTLSSQLPAQYCERLNLGCRAPASIQPEAYTNREEDGILLVPKAGELLFRLRNAPAWAC